MRTPDADFKVGGRASLRAEVDQAADVLFPLWPIDSFIAVNPLGNLTDHPFEGAIEIAGEPLQTRGYWDDEWFAAAHESGRITDADLRAALGRAARDGRLPAAPGDLGNHFDELSLDPSAPQPLGTDTRVLTPCERADLSDGGGRADAIDAEMARWCAAFLDRGQSVWSMPDRELGFYRCWRALASEDATARRLGAGDLRPAAQGLPDAPEDALEQSLARLGITRGDRVPFLRRLLGRRPGWASAIRWLAARPERPQHPIDLVDYLAILTFYESALTRGPDSESDRFVNPSQPRPDRATGSMRAGERLAIWLDAYEWHYRDRLLSRLDRPPAPFPGVRPAAQAVFCIDARSEGIRRHLEACGNYETLGFAGFFGLAIRHRGLGATAGTAQCPVLIAPSSDTTELPLAGAEADASRWISDRRTDAASIETFHQVKNDLSSKFALAELAGWAFGPVAAARTFAPGALRAPFGLADPPPPTQPVIDRPTREQAEARAAELEREIISRLAEVHLGRKARRLSDSDIERLRAHVIEAGAAPERPPGCSKRRWDELASSLRTEELSPRGHRERVEGIGAIGLSEAEQIQWAQVALTMMGLTENFAPLVLLCGHGSTTANNPYRSSLDCGACGGNQGGPNARVAAALLNSGSIREELAKAGIEIPADTRFIAGLHDTTRDRVEIFDLEQVPLTHRSDLLALERDLAHAGEQLAAERLERLPGGDGRTAGPAARRRSLDWAQVRPEWGLAKNAAFIIGPRSMSAGLDLECRTFLHSYRAEVDPDGSALETILTAPLVVAEWINLQYYFSTVDPDRFGAGDKTLHNVVGLHGVQTGPGGDLRIGLPRQSVFDGARPYHEPMRLLAAVQAPLERISSIIARNAILEEMLGGGWVAMCGRERPGDPWARLRRDLSWEPWEAAAETDLTDETKATFNGGEAWVVTV